VSKAELKNHPKALPLALASVLAFFTYGKNNKRQGETKEDRKKQGQGAKF
jgi:hypothetical protein